MARKRYATEPIIGFLREAEARLEQGQTVGAICRGLGIAEQTCYRGRREYGGRLRSFQSLFFPRGLVPIGGVLACVPLPEACRPTVGREQ